MASLQAWKSESDESGSHQSLSVVDDEDAEKKSHEAGGVRVPETVEGEKSRDTLEIMRRSRR